MLQVVRELLPYFAAFFLLEGLTWVAAGHRLAVAQRGCRFGWRTAGLRLGGLLPGSREFSAHRLLVPLAPDAVFFPKAPDLAGARRFEPAGFVRLPLAEIERVEIEQRALTVNGRQSLTLPSAAHAWELAAGIERLRRAAAPREAIEPWVERALDVDRLRVRWAEAERRVRGVERFGRALFWTAFAVLPVAAYLVPAGRWLGLVVAACGLLWLALLALGWRAARRLEVGVVRPGRGAWAIAVLFPPAAPRLAGALLREVLHGFDAVAVAAALLPRADLLAAVRAELHGVDHAERQGDDGWRYFWRRRRLALERLLATLGASRREVLATAARRDPSAEAYCPLCEGEYRAGVDACEACGIELVPFEAG